MHFIFIHGGPGLNSEPESHLIKEHFEKHGTDISFWNEPKELSDKDPLGDLVKDLTQYIQEFDHPVHLIGHSFGAKLLLESLGYVESKVKSVCLVSPAIDMISGEKYVFDIAQKLLQKNQPELANELEKYTAQLTDGVDDNRIEALKLAVQSGYFMEYFNDTKTFEKYFSYLQGENEFRLDNFLKVRPHIDQQLPDNSNFKGKSIVFFGQNDPAFKKENELKVIQKSMPEIEVEVIEGVKHYPHIETLNQFFELFLEKIDE